MPDAQELADRWYVKHGPCCAGCVAVTITHGHAECVRCRRREPHEFVGGKCPRRIEP